MKDKNQYIDLKNRCPYYRYKPKEGKVTQCKGTIRYYAGDDFGTCQSCLRTVATIIEM